MGLVKRVGAASADLDRRSRARDVAGLMAGLADDDADVRRWSALDLAHHPEATGALVGRLEVEADRAVRDAVLTTLAGFDSLEAAAGLAPHLRSEDAALRTAVVSALAGMPTAAPSVVPALLDDADPDVRILTVMVLGQLRAQQVPGWLLEVLRTDEHPNVCAAALAELAELVEPSMAGVVAAVAARFPDDPFLAFTADALLDRLGATS